MFEHVSVPISTLLLSVKWRNGKNLYPLYRFYIKLKNSQNSKTLLNTNYTEYQTKTQAISRTICTTGNDTSELNCFVMTFFSYFIRRGCCRCDIVFVYAMEMTCRCRFRDCALVAIETSTHHVSCRMHQMYVWYISHTWHVFDRIAFSW